MCSSARCSLSCYEKGRHSSLPDLTPRDLTELESQRKESGFHIKVPWEHHIYSRNLFGLYFLSKVMWGFTSTNIFFSLR